MRSLAARASAAHARPAIGAVFAAPARFASNKPSVSLADATREPLVTLRLEVMGTEVAVPLDKQATEALRSAFNSSDAITDTVRRKGTPRSPPPR